MTLRFKCPSCGRAIAPVPQMRAATQVVRRACRCGQRWQIVVTPRPVNRGGVRQMDIGTFVAIGERQ